MWNIWIRSWIIKKLIIRKEWRNKCIKIANMWQRIINNINKRTIRINRKRKKINRTKRYGIDQIIIKLNKKLWISIWKINIRK